MVRRVHHRFPKEVEQRLRPLYRLDNYHAPLYAIALLSTIGAIVLAAEAAAPYVGWYVPYLVAVVLIGALMRALATLLHESVHRCLARNAVLNFVIGTYFSGYLVLQSWHPYRSSHVFQHHHWLGDPVRDPERVFHDRQGLYSCRSRGAFLRRYFVAPVFLTRNVAALHELIRWRFLSKREPIWERVVKCAYLAGLVAIIVALGGGYHLFYYWVVPFLTVFPVVNWYNELFEHYPYPPHSETSSDLDLSRNRWPRGLERLFSGMLNENYHLVHHLRPTIPFWNLPTAHAILMADPDYHARHETTGGLFIASRQGDPSLVRSILEGLPGER